MTDPRNVSKSKNLLSVSLSVLAALPAAVVPGVVPLGPAMAQSIDCFQTLNFGTIETCATGGTVTIDPDGTRTTGGCLSSSGSSSRGRCILTGTFFPVTPMTVSVAAPTYTITKGGGDNMDVNNFQINTAGNGPAITVTAFITVVNIGADLVVGAAQPSGSYTGAVTVNVNY